MDDTERYDLVCKPAFEANGKKLDKVLELLQGNGKPGIVTRLDRLEQKANQPDTSSISGVLAYLVKNWKVAALVLILLGSWFRSGNLTTEQIQQAIEKLSETQITGQK
jgi:hypothetical protein